MTRRSGLLVILQAGGGLAAYGNELVTGKGESRRSEIRGIVQSVDHQLVAGVTVRARLKGRGAEQIVRSTEDGVFVFRNVVPGRYEVVASRAGLPSSPVAAFELSAGQSFELDLTLGGLSLRSRFWSRLAHAYETDWKAGSW